MLLSHNFNLFNNELPALNREQFAQIFIDGLSDRDKLSCNSIDNPHWIVEIIFSKQTFTAEQIGKICGELLANKRRGDFGNKSNSEKAADILLLGGMKTTPALGSPSSLQPGEWGVDVVETNSAAEFLTALGWSSRIAQKPVESIFKIEIKGEQ